MAIYRTSGRLEFQICIVVGEGRGVSPPLLATSNCLPTCYVPPDSRPYANSCCHEFFIGSSRPKLVAWLGTSSHLGYWPSECILLSSRSSSSPASINSPTNLSPRVLHPVNYTTTDSWFQLAFPVPSSTFPRRMSFYLSAVLIMSNMLMSRKDHSTRRPSHMANRVC